MVAFLFYVQSMYVKGAPLSPSHTLPPHFPVDIAVVTIVCYGKYAKEMSDDSGGFRSRHRGRHYRQST
jgi:hypothetical protein